MTCYQGSKSRRVCALFLTGMNQILLNLVMQREVHHSYIVHLCYASQSERSLLRHLAFANDANSGATNQNASWLTFSCQVLSEGKEPGVPQDKHFRSSNDFTEQWPRKFQGDARPGPTRPTQHAVHPAHTNAKAPGPTHSRQRQAHRQTVDWRSNCLAHPVSGP